MGWPLRWPASLGVGLLLLLTRTPARAQDLRFEAGEQLYALSELIEGGEPLWTQLFAHGWPTDQQHRRLTTELCGQSADAMMAAYLGSGAGVPLSSTAYEDERLQRAQKAGGGHASAAALLRAELNTYKVLSGAELTIPPDFDPVAVPHQRARAELVRPFDAKNLGSRRWKEPGAQRCSLDALGFALLAEARYARLQLSKRRDGTIAGKPAKLFGATPEAGFHGLVALHAAIAKLHELRRLVVDTRGEAFTPKTSLAGLEDFRYFVPSGFTPLAKTPVEYELLEGDDRLKSHLLGLCAVLLGAAEMVALADAEGPRELTAVFASDKPLEGTTTLLFEKNVQDVALDVAVFAFRSMRAFHVNVTLGRATSLGGPNVRGTTITPTDLGLFLLALQAFKDKVRLGPKALDRHPRKADLEEEQRKADTLLRSLGASFRQWDADEPGFYDLYSVSNNVRQAQTKSLASQAFALRGLITTHRHVAPGGEPSPFLQAAERTLRWLDREKWDVQTQAYGEKAGASAKAPALGAVAVLGALRDMALATADGRYLTRYMQYLESLAGRGLLRQPADKAAAGLAPEVTLEAGPK